MIEIEIADEAVVAARQWFEDARRLGLLAVSAVTSDTQPYTL
jgi:hypothetical protein